MSSNYDCVLVLRLLDINRITHIAPYTTMNNRQLVVLTGLETGVNILSTVSACP